MQTKHHTSSPSRVDARVHTAIRTGLDEHFRVSFLFQSFPYIIASLTRQQPPFPNEFQVVIFCEEDGDNSLHCERAKNKTFCDSSGRRKSTNNSSAYSVRVARESNLVDYSNSINSVSRMPSIRRFTRHKTLINLYACANRLNQLAIESTTKQQTTYSSSGSEAKIDETPEWNGKKNNIFIWSRHNKLTPFTQRPAI